MNGITGYFLTKLDVLSGLDQVPVHVAYELDGRRCDEIPMTQTGFHHAVPVYEYLTAGGKTSPMRARSTSCREAGLTSLSAGEWTNSNTKTGFT